MNVELTELVGCIIWFLGVYGAVQSQHIFFRSKNARKNAINFFLKISIFVHSVDFSLPFHIRHITKCGAYEISSMSKLVSVVTKNKQKQKMMWKKEEKWNRKLARLFIFRMIRNIVVDLTCIPEKKDSVS